MNDTVKSIVAPVVVAVIVGLVSGYMSSQNAIAVHSERIHSMAGRVDRLEIQSMEFGKYDARLARIEAGLDQILKAGPAHCR
jgi:hypothetical protein